MRHDPQERLFLFDARNMRVRATTSAVLAGAALMASGAISAQSLPANDQASVVANSPIKPGSPAFMAGPLEISLGGFAALETVWRSKNETADIGSNYNSGIPYQYSSNYYLNEFRESARHSRFAMLVKGPEGGGWSAQSYLETDFLSGGVTSNSTESNSYTLRIRQFYGTLRNTQMNWYLLAGQTWSLATLSGSGTLEPRKEVTPLTVDAQYVVGFNWTRNPQLRLVKLIGSNAALAVSFESPQAIFTGGTPSTTVINNPGVGGGLLPSTNNYTLDFFPDTIVKFAIDPGWGHYEVYGMGRGFRDRYEPTTGSVAGTNNTTWGGSIGAGAVLPLTSTLTLQASGLWGSGIGRYGSGQLPDVTVRPDGTIAAIREADVLVGLTYKPTDTLTLYAYGGAEVATRTAYDNTAGKHFGYGNLAYDNSGCYLATGSSTSCVANARSLRQFVVGEWWKVYQGTIGNFQVGLQYTYEDRIAFDGKGGAPSTNINMAFASFRYYPYQR